MTEPENFLERWSKRKLAKDEPEPPAREENPPPADKEAAESAPAAPASDDKAFDPATLPPIESIGADTDVTAFLRPGVPPELTRAALRRAWSADPAIRDFVGLVENGWDFNDPQAMAGFGPIDPGEVARLAGQIVGALPGAAGRDEEEKAIGTGETENTPPYIGERPHAIAAGESRGTPDRDTNVQRSVENDAAHKKLRD